MAGGVATAGVAVIYALSLGCSSFFHLLYLLFMAALGSILPDLDSDTGRPVKMLFHLASALILLPAFTLLISHGFDTSTVLISLAVVYLGWMLFYSMCKRLTVHRGIMHSIPFALMVGALAALVASGLGREVSMLAGMSVFAGVMVHLVLDEMNGVGLRYGLIPHFKRSFGTALKLTGKSITTTLAMYGVTAFFGMIYFVII